MRRNGAHNFFPADFSCSGGARGGPIERRAGGCSSGVRVQAGQLPVWGAHSPGPCIVGRDRPGYECGGPVLRRRGPCACNCRRPARGRATNFTVLTQHPSSHKGHSQSPRSCRTGHRFRKTIPPPPYTRVSAITYAAATPTGAAGHSPMPTDCFCDPKLRTNSLVFKCECWHWGGTTGAFPALRGPATQHSARAHVPGRWAGVGRLAAPGYRVLRVRRRGARVLRAWCVLVWCWCG